MRHFPEHSNPGIIILPYAPFESEAFIKSMRTVVHLIGPYRKAYHKAKIEINANGEVSVRFRNADTGQMTTTRFSFDKAGNTFVWED